jgi:hypothetical protein
LKRRIMIATTQIFVVEPGQEFEIQIIGPNGTSVADPTGCIGGITYRYKSTLSGLIPVGEPYRSVPFLRGRSAWMLERKPLT